jgi:uncharacterized RDD family membrane protein YckC
MRRVFSQPISSVADIIVPVLVDAVDIDETLGRVNLDELLANVDIDALMDRIDVQALVQKLDLNRVLDRLDLDAVLETLDLNQLLGRIDMDQLVGRVDIDGVIERVDINSVISRVEVKALVENVVGTLSENIGSTVTRGTESLLRSLRDVLRRWTVGLDMVTLGFVDRLLRRDSALLPTGPTLLEQSGTEISSSQVSGRYAGPVSRVFAFSVDLLVIFAVFTVGTSALNYLVRLLSGVQLERSGTNGVWWSVALGVWAFIYFWIGPSIAGRTLGMAIVGLRVVATDGSVISQRQSFFRVLTLPLSVVLLGVGFFMALFGKERRALHDHLARTCVVYDWGDRPAEMPAPLAKWLTEKEMSRGDDTSPDSASPREAA